MTETKSFRSHAVKTGPAFHELAIREIHHRFANTLCVLAAGVRCDFVQVTDPELTAALRRHERQIANIGELHRLLAAAWGFEKCAIPSFFQRLCHVLTRAVLAPLNLTCEVFLAEGMLQAEQCAKLALIISELVMNAAKHLFPNNKAGRVRIEIVNEGDIFRCMIVDDGIGMGSGLGGCVLESSIH